MVLCFVTHLEREGLVERVPPVLDEEPERWSAVRN
jgi:hypothetical protein